MVTKKKAVKKAAPEAEPETKKKPEPQVFIDTGALESEPPPPLVAVAVALLDAAHSINASERSAAEKFRHFAGHLRDIANGLDKEAQTLSLQ